MLKGFITNLGKYNEGYLIGEWITFPIDEDDLQEVLDRIGINAQYEEFFFTDWDCDIATGLGEYESIAAVNELAEALEEQDEELIAAIIEATGYALDEAIRIADDCVFYKHMSLTDVAYDIVEECYPELGEFALRYFDYEAFARDLSFDGYTEISNGVIYVG